MKSNEDVKKELSKFKTRELTEQTFLAWVQLGLILISLGFAAVGVISIVKAQEYKKIVVILSSLIADLFVIVGFMAVIFALIQYRRKIKNIGKPYTPSLDLPLLIGIMISTLGAIAFIAILIGMLFWLIRNYPLDSQNIF